MRYQNWDALLFPETSKVPMQEFKTTCHIVHDQEFLQTHNNVLLMPTVTCFVPGLPAGNPFFISIHSWETPEPSRYAQNFNKPIEHILFEARVFIDGRLSGAKIFGRQNDWPALIDTGIDMDKNGELDSMKFPAFHKEVLTQSFWSAGDEIGRIKIVIAEGFRRDSVSLPFERLKNIVTFSFQHAPLDTLEQASIAWPNPLMWRQVALPVQFLPQTSSPRQIISNAVIDAHAHSPRRTSSSSMRSQVAPPNFTAMHHPPTLFTRPGGAYDRDPFVEENHNPWMGRQPSSNDMAMPDYSSSSSHITYSRRVTDPMAIDHPHRKYDLQSPGAFESLCESLLPSAPVNTPQNDTVDPSNVTFEIGRISESKDLSSGLFENSRASAVIHSGSNTGGVKSRKENRSEDIFTPGNDSTPCHEGTRKVAQVFASSASGAKRQRVTTPVACKAIDEDEEPKSSPTARKMSQAQDNSQVERKALCGLEMNIV